MLEIYPTEAAIRQLFEDRVVSVKHRRPELDDMAATWQQAQKLGQVVWRNIDVLNQETYAQSPSGCVSKYDDEASWPWEEVKIADRISTWLNMLVGTEFADQQDTKRWLPNFNQVNIELREFDMELLEPINSQFDPINKVKINIRQTHEHDDYEPESEDPRLQFYDARYENGLKLDRLETETIIGVLTMIADNAPQGRGI